MEIFGLTISMAIVWIVVAVIFVAVEAMTMGLTCIWFAGGAFAAMILALLKASVWTQIFVFLIVSIVALVFTRKLFVEKLRTGTEKTNVDAIIDQEATIIETIEPHCAGIAKVGGVYEQRNFIYEALNDIPGITAVKPKAAFYIFPRIDAKKFNITNDEQFALDLLREKKILIIHGGGFNWKNPDHFRVVYLPRVEVLKDATEKLADFLTTYKQK